MGLFVLASQFGMDTGIDPGGGYSRIDAAELADLAGERVRAGRVLTPQRAHPEIQPKQIEVCFGQVELVVFRPEMQRTEDRAGCYPGLSAGSHATDAELSARFDAMGDDGAEVIQPTARIAVRGRREGVQILSD